MKIWQCYDNLPAQEWYYTADNRIALENQGSIFRLIRARRTDALLLRFLPRPHERQQDEYECGTDLAVHGQ